MFVIRHKLFANYIVCTNGVLKWIIDFKNESVARRKRIELLRLYIKMLILFDSLIQNIEYIFFFVLKNLIISFKNVRGIFSNEQTRIKMFYFPAKNTILFFKDVFPALGEKHYLKFFSFFIHFKLSIGRKESKLTDL